MSKLITASFFSFAVGALAMVGMISYAHPGLAAGPDAGMSRTEVEKIVRDYIMNNPKDILDSVDAYQRQMMADKANNSAKALKENKDAVFNTEGAPFTGAEDADVTVVEFFDYNCGYCKHALPEVQKLLSKDKKLKVVLKDFPILGPTSELASKWALAAHKQGKYFEFHRLMMEHKGAISMDVLTETSKKAGLDLEQMQKDAESTDVMMQIEKNRALASTLGITGTPAFIIGDEVVPGAIPAAEIERRVNAIRSGADEKDEKKAE